MQIKHAILLAGGLGTRMGKCTHVTNKHLLPIYERPMIDYSLSTLRHIGIKHVLIVTGDKSASDIMKYVNDGKEHGFENVYYVIQNGNGGISDAIRLGKHFTNQMPFCVLLGDNILSSNLIINNEQLCDFLSNEKKALICFKTVSDNTRFGVPTFNEHGQLIHITEKPSNPDSEYAQIGLYFYHSNVYDLIDTLHVSERDELEVTDLNNLYLNDNLLNYFLLDRNVFWSDAGNNETLLYCSNYVRKHSDDFN